MKSIVKRFKQRSVGFGSVGFGSVGFRSVGFRSVGFHLQTLLDEGLIAFDFFFCWLKGLKIWFEKFARWLESRWRLPSGSPLVAARSRMRRRPSQPWSKSIWSAMDGSERWQTGPLPFRATCDALQGLFLKISPIPRFVECVLPKGGIDPYLTAKYGSEAGPLLLSDSKGHLLHCAIQEGLLDFAKWIDEFAPADGSPGAWILMTFCLPAMFCDYTWQLWGNHTSWKWRVQGSYGLGSVDFVMITVWAEW